MLWVGLLAFASSRNKLTLEGTIPPESAMSPDVKALKCSKIKRHTVFLEARTPKSENQGVEVGVASFMMKPNNTLSYICFLATLSSAALKILDPH